MLLILGVGGNGVAGVLALVVVLLELGEDGVDGAVARGAAGRARRSTWTASVASHAGVVVSSGLVSRCGQHQEEETRWWKELGCRQHRRGKARLADGQTAGRGTRLHRGQEREDDEMG